jgi:hypothetical protein
LLTIHWMNPNFIWECDRSLAWGQFITNSWPCMVQCCYFMLCVTSSLFIFKHEANLSQHCFQNNFPCCRVTNTVSNIAYFFFQIHKHYFRDNT